MINIILNPIRNFLGALIRIIDHLTSPKPIVRLPEGQKLIDASTHNLALYAMANCPFCIKVQREIRRLNLKIETRDIKLEPKNARDLLEGGKLDQVPCLRITSGNNVQWLYESNDIIKYLRENFS